MLKCNFGIILHTIILWRGHALGKSTKRKSWQSREHARIARGGAEWVGGAEGGEGHVVGVHVHEVGGPVHEGNTMMLGERHVWFCNTGRHSCHNYIMEAPCWLGLTFILFSNNSININDWCCCCCWWDCSSVWLLPVWRLGCDWSHLTLFLSVIYYYSVMSTITLAPVRADPYRSVRPSVATEAPLVAPRP